MRKKNRQSQGRVVEIVLGEPLYKLLRSSAGRDGITESDALLAALERGMKDFPLRLAHEYRQDVAYIMNLYEECGRDNATLRHLASENERMADLLKAHGPVSSRMESQRQ